MARLKVVLFLGICATILNQSSSAKVLSPDPSLEIFFPPLAQDATNQSAASTTATPTISQRIHATLNNVLQIPIPIWGTVAIPGSGTPTLSQAQQPSLPAQVSGGGSISSNQRQQLEQQQNVLGQEQPHQIGVFRKPIEAQGAPPPSSFLPIPVVNEAIHSTIAQLSTLSHWPFGYITTSKPQQPVQAPVPTTVPPTQRARPSTTTAPSTTTTAATTTTTQATTKVPQNAVAPPPLPAVPPTQAMAPPPQQTPPSFLLPSNGGPLFSFPQPVQTATQRPSLPDRIHNRIHSTLNYIRLPSLSQIGQPRPRPMLTEPPWVTELLGPTLEPPTTRAPTLGERVHNSIQNVLLFVPATILNFWYETWGTQHVDRFINRLQLSTPRPGSPPSAVFATISQDGPNPFANFTTGSLSGNNSSSSNSSDYPAIAAFINTNGKLMPTIVHPVVNKTANTIEYQLRSENETTVLWTGTLSNDIFFGNKKPSVGGQEVDDEEEDQQIKFSFNIEEE